MTCWKLNFKNNMNVSVENSVKKTYLLEMQPSKHEPISWKYSCLCMYFLASYPCRFGRLNCASLPHFGKRGLSAFRA